MVSSCSIDILENDGAWMERSDLSNTDHSLDWAAANIYIGIDIDILIDILIEIDTNNQTKTYIHIYICV